jgi:outer membrane protein OmpA-like peptidoglycan-associated protein
MRKLKIYYLLVPFLMLINLNTIAQTYNRAFKFNYGVFLYNDINSVGIKQPFDAPLSLGLQYQSNLSKAFTNSIGANVYRWSRGSVKNESFSFQDVLFLRNNAMLFNRFKPQIGLGLGFEERKTNINNQTAINQLLFIPVNIGFQTDLTEQLALGIFSEIRYGFDLKNFNLNNGQILPNNTAGLSLSYRFGRVKENKRFQPVNWNVNPEELLTLDDFKTYLDTTRQNKISYLQPLKTNTLGYRRDSLLTLNNKLNTVGYDNLNNLYSVRGFSEKISEQDKLSKKPILKANNFKLSDFKENQSLAYPDTILIETQQKQVFVPQVQRITKTDTVYINNQTAAEPQRVYSEYRQPEVIYRSTYQDQNDINRKIDNRNGEKEIVDVVSAGAFSIQLAQLLSMQKETNRLLQNQMNGNQTNAPILPVIANQRLNSLALKIDSLEQKITVMDSLMRLDKVQKIGNVKEDLVVVADKPLNNNTNIEKTKLKPEEPKNVEFANIKAIITFPINQSEINDMQRTLILNQLIKEYQSNGKYNVVLESYTDASGTGDYNKRLAQLRIDQMILFLTSYGVNKEDIVSKNFGETKASEKVNKEERKIIIKLIKK